MRDPFSELISTRKSLPYYDESAVDTRLRAHLERRSRRSTGSLGYMFNEDAHQILPYGRGEDDGFGAAVVPDCERIRELVINALTSVDNRPRTLEDGVRQCVRYLSEQLLDGTAVFEVDYLRLPKNHDATDCQTNCETTDDANDPAPAAFEIGWIPSGTTERRRGRYIQYVPSGFGSKTTRSGLHYIELDGADLVVIELNRSQRSALARARSVLEVADGQDETPYNFLTSNDANFDFTRFKSERARLVLRGTRQLGWDARRLFDDHMLDPYMFWRHLQFERFKIGIRDAVLLGVNQMIELAGKRMGFSAQLVLTGLITTDDVDEAEQSLASGDRPLIDLIYVQA